MDDLHKMDAYVNEVQDYYHKTAEARRKLNQTVAQEQAARMERTRQAALENARQERIRSIRLSIAFERARLACIALCTQIYTAFPYEIRAMIYDHLIPPGVLHNVLEARDERGNVILSNNPLVSTSFFHPRSRIPNDTAVRRDCWKYTEYTGPIVGVEIAERWYQTAHFVIYAEDKLFVRLLEEDVWGRGVIPAQCIRHIRLVIPNYILHPPHKRQDRNARAQVLHNFEMLRRLRNKKAVIEIIFPYIDVHILRQVHTILHELKEQGYGGVKIPVPEECRLWVEGGGLEVDLSWVFDMGRQEFDEVFGKEESKLMY